MNGDAIKDFLFRHFEKFIFGLLAVVALFLVYQGFSKPDILAKHQPEKMQQSATQVKNQIDEDHWDTIKTERIVPVNIIARTNASIRPVDPTPYVLPVPWEGKSVDMNVKRTDPKVPAPFDLHVTGVMASLAWKVVDPKNPNPLPLLDPADAVEKVEEKPKGPKTRKGRTSMEDMYGAEGSMGSGGYGSGGDYGGGEFGGASGGGYEGMRGGPGGIAVTPVRPVDATKYDQGFRPVGDMATFKPEFSPFIAGVALMPQKLIYREFSEKLEQADGYIAQRDQPYFVAYRLFRADVTDKPVDQLTDADWTPRGSSKYVEQLWLYRWAGTAKEIVSLKYRDTALTSAIPPVLLDNYTWFSTHPKIPIGDEVVGMVNTSVETQNLGPVGPLLPSASEGDLLSSRVRANTQQSQEYGQGGYGQGGYGQGAYGANTKVEQPEFKLIRFYDFATLKDDPGAPKPGRRYVYRIQVAVEDPNFPADPTLDPRSSTLSSEVFARVDKLKAVHTAALANNPKAVRDSLVWSEFSKPSPPVSLPVMNQAFVGPIEPGSTRVYTLGKEEIQFSNKPPKANIVVAKWMPQYGVPVPVIADVQRGSVLNKTGVFDVIDPLNLEVRKLPDTTVINTSNVILDLSGGNPLVISPAENQTEPGVVLMFDPSGGLEVVDEIETQRGYRLYSAADERGL